MQSINFGIILMIIKTCYDDDYCYNLSRFFMMSLKILLTFDTLFSNICHNFWSYFKRNITYMHVINSRVYVSCMTLQSFSANV